MHVHAWIEFNPYRVRPGRLSAVHRRELWDAASAFAALASGWRYTPPALYPTTGGHWLPTSAYVTMAARWRYSRRRKDSETPFEGIIIQGGVYVDFALEWAAASSAARTAARVRQAAEDAARELRRAARSRAARQDLAARVREGNGVVAFPA